mmetsp:Transcript_6683/g.10976  ORF Transcript_6683/g.10976 Transcript_6683/m.10976 type:complete len:236 (-) Transcript_6683:211-918(-)
MHNIHILQRARHKVFVINHDPKLWIYRQNLRLYHRQYSRQHLRAHCTLSISMHTRRHHTIHPLSLHHNQLHIDLQHALCRIDERHNVGHFDQLRAHKRIRIRSEIYERAIWHQIVIFHCFLELRSECIACIFHIQSCGGFLLCCGKIHFLSTVQLALLFVVDFHQATMQAFHQQHLVLHVVRVHHVAARAHLLHDVLPEMVARAFVADYVQQPHFLVFVWWILRNEVQSFLQAVQ